MREGGLYTKEEVFMKKLAVWLMLAVMIFAAISGGCGGGSDNDSSEPEQTESINQDTGSDTGDYDPNEGGKGTSGTGEIDLSKITADYIAKDGEILTGELGENANVSIADGATVTIRDVTMRVGLTCQGSATLILDGTNYVTTLARAHSAIYVPRGKTLTIKGSDKGSGKLTADASSTSSAGIGAGYRLSCGNIVIEGGTIDAIGGYQSAGIGGTHFGYCGDITINGGTVTAAGGFRAPSVGGKCGTITINGEKKGSIYTVFNISL